MRAIDAERLREGLLQRSPRQGWFDGLIRLIARVGFGLFAWRVDVRGLENVPRTGGYVAVGAPHRAWVDPFLLILAWPWLARLFH